MGAGGDANKPVANVSLMSIGRLGLSENKKHSGDFQRCTNQIGIIEYDGPSGATSFCRFIDHL
jgi:hypothetical protein